MPAARVTVKTKIFELEIVLEEVQPLVRRRVQVPGEVSLAVLHEVVQSAVGWTNSHLHEFEIAGCRYGMPDPDWGDQDVIDEAKGTLFRLVGQGDRSAMRMPSATTGTIRSPLRRSSRTAYLAATRARGCPKSRRTSAAAR